MTTPRGVSSISGTAPRADSRRRFPAAGGATPCLRSWAASSLIAERRRLGRRWSDGALPVRLRPGSRPCLRFVGRRPPPARTPRSEKKHERQNPPESPHATEPPRLVRLGARHSVPPKPSRPHDRSLPSRGATTRIAPHKMLPSGEARAICDVTLDGPRAGEGFHDEPPREGGVPPGCAWALPAGDPDGQGADPR